MRLSRPGWLTRPVAVALVAALIVAAAAVALLMRPAQHSMTVDFDRTVSLYEGSKVRVLGVDVGTVDRLTPRGSTVRATITWDADVKVPADVRAVIVSPSVVGDRFVQLTPAYTGGSTLPDGTHLDQSRTGTPTELDETVEALDRLSVALGPEGANADGALSGALSSSAANLDGQGAAIRRSLTALADVTSTADGSKDELFAAVQQIERFVSALEASDSSVRSFNTSLAGVSGVLADEGDDLQLALRELAGTLTQVNTYVTENRTGLRRNVDGLTEVTESLAAQRDHLDALLKQGPKALTNLALRYNPTTGTIDTRSSTPGATLGDVEVLKEPTIVTGYCGMATDQNPGYSAACQRARSLLIWLGAQAPSRKTGGAN